MALAVEGLTVATITDAELARRMFDAYNAQGPNPWKTFDGRDVPRWDALSDQVRAKWTAAAAEAMQTLIDFPRGTGFSTNPNATGEPSPTTPAPRPKPGDK